MRILIPGTSTETVVLGINGRSARLDRATALDLVLIAATISVEPTDITAALDDAGIAYETLGAVTGDEGGEVAPGGSAASPVPVAPVEPVEPSPFDLTPLDGSIDDLVPLLAEITDPEHLAALLEAEKNGKTRIGAHNAIAERIAGLTPQE